jgi:protein TonB
MAIAGGILISLLILAMLPFLLRPAALSQEHAQPLAARLIPLVPEEFIDTKKLLEAPETQPPPPEVQFQVPKLSQPVLPGPQMETPEIKLSEGVPHPAEMDALDAAKPLFEAPAESVVAMRPLAVSNSQLNLERAKVPLPQAMPIPPPSAKPIPTKALLPQAKPKSQLPAAASQTLTASKPPPPANALPTQTKPVSTAADRSPQAISKIRPIYPLRARRLAIEGYIVAHLLVDCNGKIAQVRILKAQPEGVFERSVKKATARWRFKPALKYGQPAEAWIKTKIVFNLKEQS